MREPISPFWGERYVIIPKVDQTELFGAVENELRNEGCIGIFPEGGSHDQTNLLPLKAGVCIMALGCMDKHEVPVAIQCVGLNYYEGYKFRSNAAVNFGSVYEIPWELVQLYRSDKRAAVGQLLKEIENRIKECWYVAEDYEELQHIFLARSVYKPNSVELTQEQRHGLNLRFTKGYKKI